MLFGFILFHFFVIFSDAFETKLNVKIDILRTFDLFTSRSPIKNGNQAIFKYNLKTFCNLKKKKPFKNKHESAIKKKTSTTSITFGTKNKIKIDLF